MGGQNEDSTAFSLFRFFRWRAESQSGRPAPRHVALCATVAAQRAADLLPASSSAGCSVVTGLCGRCPLWTFHTPGVTQHAASCVWLLPRSLVCSGFARVALCVGRPLLSVAESYASVWTHCVSGAVFMRPQVPLCRVAFLAVVNSVPRDSHPRVFVRWTSSCLGCRPGGVGISWGCFLAVLSRFPFKCVKQLCCL